MTSSFNAVRELSIMMLTNSGVMDEGIAEIATNESLSTSLH